MSAFRSVVACIALVGLLLLEVPSSAQAIPGGASAIPGGAGIRRGVRVLVVDDDPLPCPSFTSVQAAIDDAAEGDVVLVKPGSYGGLVIDGKALTLIGEGLPSTGIVIVQNLLPGQTVALRGLRTGRITVRDSAGFVWGEDCRTFYSWDLTRARAGAFRCEASQGVRANESTFVAYQSTFFGQQGSYADCDDLIPSSSCSYEQQYDGGSGRPAVSTLTSAPSDLYLIGSDLTGGAGGDGALCDCNGNCLDAGCGGAALSIGSSSSAYVLDTLLTEGPTGYRACGAGVICFGGPFEGAPQFVPRLAGAYWVDAPQRDGEPLRYHLRGQPGWQVHLRQSAECEPGFEPDYRGFAVVPVDRLTLYLGEIPATGELDVEIPFASHLAPGAEARVVYLQADFLDPISGISVLGTPSLLVVHRNSCP